MSGNIGSQLHGLARRQRMRIWIKRLGQRIPPLLWWNACVLFPAAWIHQLVLPLNSAAVLCVAVAPSLLALIWFTVTDSPTVDEGAASADRRLGANSLFVSAWELCRSAAVIEGTGALLLARAEAAMPGWRRHEHTPPRRDMTPASLAALTLALAGLLFLLSPTHVNTAAPQSAAAATPEQRVSRADDPATVLSQLFKPAEQTPVPIPAWHAETQPRPAPVNSAEQQTPLQGEPESTQHTGEQLARIHAQASAPRATADAERLPGTPDSARAEGEKIPDRTPGNEAADNAGGPTSTAQRFSRTRMIDIDTDEDSRSTTFDADRGGAALLASGPQPEESRRPAAGPARTASRSGAASLLSAAQRTLVWRYFKQLEKTDEPNE